MKVQGGPQILVEKCYEHFHAKIFASLASLIQVSMLISTKVVFVSRIKKTRDWFILRVWHVEM